MLVTDLPPEILLLLIEFVPAEHLYSLALSCRCFKSLLYPHLWASLCVESQLSADSHGTRAGPAQVVLSYRQLANPSRRLVPASFLRENKWRAADTRKSSLRQFCKALARGDLDQVVKYVRYLTVFRPFYAPLIAEEYQHQLPDLAVDQASDPALERLLLERVLPSRLTHLEALEVQSSDDFLPRHMTYPIINTMIQQFTSVRKTVGYDLFSPVSPKLAIRDVTTLVLYISDIDSSSQLVNLFRSKCLPSGVRRFELSFHQESFFEIQAAVLEDFFSQSTSLSILSLSSMTIVNSKTVNWVPSSVTSLKLDDIDSDDEQLSTFVNGSNLAVMSLTTETGSILAQSRLGNLRHVELSPLQNISHEYIQNAAFMLQSNPSISLLKLVDTPYQAVSLILQQQLPAQIQCLYLEYYPKGMFHVVLPNEIRGTILDDSLECLADIAPHCSGLESLILDINLADLHSAVTVISSFLKACPKLHKLCFIDCSLDCSAWTMDDYIANEFDNQSSIAFDNRWKLVDIAKFKSSYGLN